MYFDQYFRVFGKGSHLEKKALLKKPKGGDVVNIQRTLDFLIWNLQNNKITYSPVKITEKELLHLFLSVLFC